MKLNFRKIASVLASAVMIGSTVGTALAANYPAPFVVGGKADAAIVVTSGSHLGASSDLFAAIDLQKSLQNLVTSSTTSSTGSVSGEAAPLFTGSSKIYMNDTLNSVKNVVTKTEMPTLLADGSFSGNVDASFTQTIYLGTNPQLVYAKQPTSSDDPRTGFSLSTSTSAYVYNTTVTFNKAVNLTHADSKNQDLTIFGQKFTIGSATTGTDLVLLKESQKVNFDSSGTTSSDVIIGGKTYTVELVSASTTTATVKITNKETGTSDSKEVSEGASKKINGLTIAVNTADSNNLKYTASVVAGAEKYTLSTGSALTYGDDATSIDGTKVTFDANPTVGTTKITISVAASSSDKDAIAPGNTLVDPIFGTFKIDFSGLNIDDNSSARETIKVYNNADDKMLLDMTDSNGNAKTGIQWLMNRSAGKMLEWDQDGHQIAVVESAVINKSDYVVVGMENEGRLVKLTTITNQTTGYSNDKVIFTDVFSGDTYTATLTNDGVGTVTIGGKVYNIQYGAGDSTIADEARQLRLNYPDSTSATDMILYPTISTSKGAKVMFYTPLNTTITARATNINLDNWDGLGTVMCGGTNAVTSYIKVPNGANGYKNIPVLQNVTGFPQTGNFSINGVTLGNGTSRTSVDIGSGITLNFAIQAGNRTVVYLNDTSTKGDVITPALVIFEEKDDNAAYNALIVTTEGAGNSADGIGISDVVRTWNPAATGTGTTNFRDTAYSNNKLVKSMDLIGAVITVDSSDSDQKIATISYPDEQVYAQVYVAASGASITPGTTGSGGGVVSVVKDTQVSTVSGSNLVVVGGSCINTVAAKILGSDTPLCAADFTTATNADAGKYIIKAVASPYNSAKTAVLVAGYEAAQTVDAVNALKGSQATDVGTTKVGPTTV